MRKALRNESVQSFVSAILCIVLGLLIGYIVLLIINPSGIHNHDINNPAHYSPGTRQEIMDFIAQYVPYGNDPAIAKRPVISISHKMKDQFMIRRW